MNDLSSKIKKSLLNEKASLIGFANIGYLPQNVRHSLNYAISIAVALDPSIIAKLNTGPTQEYYLEYQRANYLLSYLGKFTADMLRDNGYKAIPMEPTSDSVNQKTLSTALPHKTVATRAGLGWIGKSALLITEEYGAAIRLNTVLTDAELDTVIPIEVSHCNECMICVDSCPSRVHTPKNWNVNMKREDFYDAFACKKTLRDFEEKIGIGICGICIAVCPWTKKYIAREGGV
jgi:epoxyqueuosine reductase QueG